MVSDIKKEELSSPLITGHEGEEEKAKVGSCEA
jgi:hypothetical protein